jgi:hypothetical protein
MLKYESGVWVPYPEAKPHEIVVRDHKGDPLIEMNCPMILITLEELKEVWAAGVEKGWEVSIPVDDDPAPEFDAFIKSKGINL